MQFYLLLVEKLYSSIFVLRLFSCSVLLYLSFINCGDLIDMVEEGKALADRPHIVISTPGRLADHINTGTNFSLKKLRFLVTVFHPFLCTVF